MSLTDTKVKMPDQRKRPSSSLTGLASIDSKYWQSGYRFNGKQKVFSIGVYPAVSLADARQRRDEVKRLLDQGLTRTQKQADEKILQEKRDKTRSFRVVAKS